MTADAVAYHVYEISRCDSEKEEHQNDERGKKYYQRADKAECRAHKPAEKTAEKAAARQTYAVCPV